MRRAVEGKGASFGWQRVTVGELTARLAATRLADAGLVQVASLVRQAVAARTVHGLRAEGQLGRYAPVGDRPGLPRALERTFTEFGLAGVAPDAVSLEPDLRRCFAAYRRALKEAGLADRSDVLRAATARVEEAAPHPLLDMPTVLFDVTVESHLEERLFAALAARSSVRAIVPSGGGSTRRRLEAALDAPAEPLPDAGEGRALDRLRERLFVEELAPSVGQIGRIDATVELLSAPGESRECVEIARRVLAAAEAGTPFDRMAVLTHAPDRYRAHLVEAFRRAQVPAHFSRGTVAPDPSGRALLALLACREERLSARAFAEYLSLGAVPELDEAGAPPDADREVAWLAPDDELAPTYDDEASVDEAEGDEPVDDARAVARGTLRAPWRWESLIVDAAVIGEGTGRWRRRLEALARRLEERSSSLDDPDDPRHEALARRRRDLQHLSDFALPLLEELAALPREATWGEWADHLARLATRAIREPARVLAVLRELAPMGPIGPVGPTEVQLVLSDRLSAMVRVPKSAPAGKLYVASTREARGLSFDVVFVPGLVERVFPKKVTEDPIALDASRAEISPELATRSERVEQERLALRLAIGAAEQRLVLSYPRLDAERGRPRVPSFYALEVLRAIEGELPSYEALSRRAEASGASRMGWPAPEEPEAAIDGAEYDLAVLSGLLHGEEADVKGAARHLVEVNTHLARALRARAARWQVKRWTKNDGLVNPSDEALAALASHQLSARPYSATALAQLAVCPYRFYLRAILGLSPLEAPEAIEELDPLSRGTLIHAAQFGVLQELRARGLLPVTEERLDEAKEILDEVMARVADEKAEELAPSIERVFSDAVADARADLAEWLLRMSEHPEWVPIRFELAFGLRAVEGRDAASVDEPVRLAEGITLRGAIDMVEERDGALRATDHKTGRASAAGAVIGGGRSLQPVLYARALEELFPDREVVGGRLYHCTSRGGFEERVVALSAPARDALKALVEAVGVSLESGFFPALPEDDACARCEYRPICGPLEARRTQHKDKRGRGPLNRLRKQP